MGISNRHPNDFQCYLGRKQLCVWIDPSKTRKKGVVMWYLRCENLKRGKGREKWKEKMKKAKNSGGTVDNLVSLLSNSN
jgi:hypothetical protein